MKKIICVLIALMLVVSLAACGSSGGSSQNSSGGSSGNNAAPQNNSENKGNKDQDPPKAAYTVENAVIADNDSCRLTLTSVKDGKSYLDLVFLCENKLSDKTLMFSIDDVTADGYVVSTFFAEEVAAGKKSNETMSLDKKDLSAWGVDAVDELSMKLRVYDSNDWLADEFVEDRFDVYLTGKSASEVVYPERMRKEGETVVVDNDSCSFVIYENYHDSIWGYTLSVYLQNKTDHEIMFSWDDTSVNGFMIDPLWARSVPAGKAAYSTINFSDSKLEENGIKEVSEIEFELRVHNEEDYSAKDHVNEVFTYKP